jgi:hypothetical protein
LAPAGMTMILQKSQRLFGESRAKLSQGKNLQRTFFCPKMNLSFKGTKLALSLGE